MTRRFIAPQARAGDGRGYYNRPQRPTTTAIPDAPDVVERVNTRTAMCDEPEAPSPAWVNAQAELAAERCRLRRLDAHLQAVQIRSALTIENRIKDAARRAKLQHVDLSSEFFVIWKMLARGNQLPALDRLERVEARLDGVPPAEAA